MDLKEAEQLAIELLDKHGLLDLGWCFEYDNAKRRFGLCRYRIKTIQLSKPLTELNNLESVTDTILHEIAHALVGHIHGHDHVWRAKALEIGCDGKRCYDNEIIQPKKSYLAICENGHKIMKFRKPKRTQSCGKCSRTFNPNAILVWEKIN